MAQSKHQNNSTIFCDTLALLVDYHGFSGPVKVTDAAETPEITEAILKVAQEIEEYPADVNGKEQIGKAKNSILK